MLTRMEKHVLRVLREHEAEEEKGYEGAFVVSLAQRGYVATSPYTKHESGFVSRVISITDADRAALERSEG